MNEQIDWHELIDKGLPLLGVVIGALLTPFVSEIIGNAKRKKIVVNDLTESLLIFFSEWNNYIMEVNYFGLYNQMAVKLSETMTEGFVNGDSVHPFRQRRLDFYNEMERMHRTNAKVHYSEKTKVEAKITALIIEIKQLYGNKKYKALKELISPQLSEANTRTGSYVYEYLKLSLQECDEIAAKLPDKVMLRGGQLEALKISILEQTIRIME